MADPNATSGPPVLVVEIINWMDRTGVSDLKNHEGLWHGETDEWRIKFNPHGDEVNVVSPYTFEMAHKEFFRFAVVAPNGGALGGISEGELIQHFKQADQTEKVA